MTTMQTTIRSPVAEDRTRWESLWQAYLEFYHASRTAEVTQELWRRILDPTSDIQCRVAEHDSGELVGLVHFFAHEHTWYIDPVCYLNDLFVSPEIRGMGTGERLIAAVVDVARQQGWAEVYWHTQANNAVARGLYDKITGGTDGFVNYSVELSN